MQSNKQQGRAPHTRSEKIIRRVKDNVREIIGRHAPLLARRITNFHRLEDRVFMEATILPFFRNEPDLKKILFVGTEWYTKPYNDLFADKDYWTLEIDPDNARFGSRNHIVAPLSEIERHVRPESFDAILCNGVFYAGAMELREEAEPSFDACRRSLKPGGWFVLGWNDTPELRPYHPSESEALGRFESAPFPPIGTNQHRTSTEYRHVYNFYRAPR